MEPTFIKTEPSAPPRSGSKEPSILSISGAEAFLNNCEKIRAIRDAFGGNLKESEKYLSQITGKFTNLEAVTRLLNNLEIAAGDNFEQWRRDLSYVPPSQTSEKPAADIKNPDVQLLELYEAYRVIVQTKDKGLIKCWFAEQSYPMKFLIVNLFAKVANTAS